MREKIVDILVNTVKDFNESLPEDEKLSTDLNEALYGGDSRLDSLGLVSLIVGIEQNIEDHLEQTISLADEKAMSQKSNPFKNLDSLTSYIIEQVK